jgi:hypothetical protein
MRAQVRARTPRFAHHPQSDERAHTRTHAGAVTQLGAQARARAHSHVQGSSLRIVPRTHADTLARKQTNKLAGSQMRTHEHTHTRIHTHIRARALAQELPHERAHTHIPTHTHRRLALRRARERVSAAGGRRSIGPLSSATRRLWRCCLRMAPTFTRRTIPGAAAGRYLGQRSACAAPPWPTGTAPMQCGFGPRTHAQAQYPP